MPTVYLFAAFAPLVGAIIAGFFGQKIGRSLSHWVTILGVLVSFVASVIVLREVMAGKTFNGTLYTWAIIGGVKFAGDRDEFHQRIAAGAKAGIGNEHHLQ